MNEYDVRRLGMILAVQAEIEGMKAENTQREMEGHSIAYADKDFNYLSERIKSISICTNDQLMSL